MRVRVKDSVSRRGRGRDLYGWFIRMGLLLWVRTIRWDMGWAGCACAAFRVRVRIRVRVEVRVGVRVVGMASAAGRHMLD